MRANLKLQTLECNSPNRLQRHAVTDITKLYHETLWWNVLKRDQLGLRNQGCLPIAGSILFKQALQFFGCLFGATLEFVHVVMILIACL